MVDPDFNVWDGNYGSFAEAPALGPGFNGSIWRDRSIRAAREAAARMAKRESLDYSLRQRNALLPAVTATILTEQARVKILDFGGGLGCGYILLSQAMPHAIERIEYTVVDVESISEGGLELFAGKRGPVFHSELPPDAAGFDIVHASSVIQYIEDWQGLIRRLARYDARFLSLADIFIGEFRSYVTLQNYYASRIRHWFFNASEFIGEVESNGYRLVLRAECDAKILGRYGPLPMENFSPAQRLAHASNLLFCRERVP